MQNHNHHLLDDCEYVPTPAQIRERSQRIQETWSEGKRRTRAGLPAREPRFELEPQRIEIDERGTVME